MQLALLRSRSRFVFPRCMRRLCARCRRSRASGKSPQSPGRSAKISQARLQQRRPQTRKDFDAGTAGSRCSPQKRFRRTIAEPARASARCNQLQSQRRSCRIARSSRPPLPPRESRPRIRTSAESSAAFRLPDEFVAARSCRSRDHPSATRTTRPLLAPLAHSTASAGNISTHFHLRALETNLRCPTEKLCADSTASSPQTAGARASG